MLTKRQLILDEYKTAEDGLWTLARCKITKASQVQTYVQVPGRYAPIDYSTALTDGLPYYGSASLEVVLESSEGTRAERQARIDYLLNRFDGMIAQIVHPDHPNHYHTGRLTITPEYNDLAHCSVKITSKIEPWRYNNEETVVTADLDYSAGAQTITLTNAGKLAVCPMIEIVGQPVQFIYGEYTTTLSKGTYQLPDIFLTTGQHDIQCGATKGVNGETSTVTFRYREAVLAG